MQSKQMGRLLLFITGILLLIIPPNLKAQETPDRKKNVLFINSYSLTYSLGDSLTKGIINTFNYRNDISLFVEFLDTDRFRKTNFKESFTYFDKKYKTTKFDICIVNDTEGLGFVQKYGDILLPNIPIVFYGVENPEDYHLSNRKCYGIKNGVIQDSVIKLVLSLMPSIEYLYFIFESTNTNQAKINEIKNLESKYKYKLNFIYINKPINDSLSDIVRTPHKNSAILYIDLQPNKRIKNVQSNINIEQITKIAPIPVFIDGETFLGKGTAGGIINRTSAQGIEIANLAIHLLDNPQFTPEQNIITIDNKYYFDYSVLKRYSIDTNRLPEGSIILNAPTPFWGRSIHQIIAYILIILFLIAINLILFINISNRKEAEKLVSKNFKEIQEKNSKLEYANILVNEMNMKLEGANNKLKESNQALFLEKRKSEESDRLKTAFLSNMSHEIRTPLNAIVGFAGLLIDQQNTQEEKTKFINLINSNSEQLLRLINDILDLSKTEVGDISINEELFSVQEALIEMANVFQHSNKNRDVEIRISEFSLKNMLILKSDPVRFKQILNNLIFNALKFTDRGYVEFGFFLDNPELVTFYVKDTGIGISDKYRNRVFERFWKINDNNGKVYNGTGLGLAISKKLCEKLGGDIWFDSEPGKGTTFYFSHPRFFTNETFTSSKLLKNSETDFHCTLNGKGKIIVIVEDDRDNQSLLNQILSKSGFKVISLYNGQEVLDYLSKHSESNVDLILMDIKMPKIDGIKAASIIKKSFPEVPIIAQTAYALSDDILHIKNSDFDDFILKPIHRKDLLEKISKFLIQDSKFQI
jgi:signal transduction histidine kinase/CheY-like chemotaxis protein